MKIDLRRDTTPQRPNTPPAGGNTHPAMPYTHPTHAGHASNISPEKPKRDTSTPKIMDWIIQGAIYLLTFLLPLFFLPNVPSILELNKQALLVLVGGIAFLAWIGKLAWEGRIRIKKNFLLIPVLILLLILSLSTVFSVYRDQSTWGSLGNESLSLVSFISLIALFLVITNNFSSREKINYLLLTFIGSSFLASLYAMFQIFGKFIFKNPSLAQASFNSIGSVYSFSIFIGSVLILTTAALLEKRPNWLKIALVICALLFIFMLIAINFRTSMIIFLVGMAILLGLAIISSGNEEKNTVLIIPMVALALVLISTLIGRTGSIVRVQLPVEVGLSQSASFDVVKSAWKDHALLGSGLSNYDLDYLKGKPAEINLTNFWTVRFNEAASRFLTLATSTGFLGAAAILFLIISMVYYVFSSLVKIFGKHDEGIYTLIGITAAWIYLTVSLFFYASNISLDFSWWLLTALFATLATIVFKKKEEIISETSSPRLSLILSFVFVIIIVGFISLIFLEGQKYAAAVVYNKALKNDTEGAKVEDLITQLNRVVNLDPSRDLYHRNLSVALFAYLNQKVAEKGIGNLSENDRADISNLYFTAEDQIKTAITLDPNNPDNFIQMAQINQNVIGSKDGADQAALDNYMSALKLSPKDPSIYYQIGQIYLTMADLETAKETSQQKQGSQMQLPEKAKEDIVLAKQNFEKAVGLKSNYIPAQFMIAVALQKLGQIDDAIAKLEESQKMNPQDAGISFQLGVLYYQTGKHEKAKTALESTTKLVENYSNALYFLGLTYDKLGDKDDAIKEFQKVADLNPDNEDVKKVISNLKSGKSALDGLDQATAGQNPDGQTAPDQSSIQRDQQPVPPNTPIGPDQNQENPEEVNPEQQPAP
ncbi:MAG: tetratricopeptide repeat protein [Candidatus Moranbacteria bacterium]|nr:tetratricopeptide repeat protein [Candidatus Moranbacteria bacterium]